MSKDDNNLKAMLSIRQQRTKKAKPANYDLIQLATQAAKAGVSYGKFVSKNKI